MLVGKYTNKIQGMKVRCLHEKNQKNHWFTNRNSGVYELGGSKRKHIFLSPQKERIDHDGDTTKDRKNGPGTDLRIMREYDIHRYINININFTLAPKDLPG